MKVKTHAIAVTLLLLSIMVVAGCSAPLSTREKGGLIGLGLGAGTGAIIGSTAGNAAAGAAIGGPIGLIGGALLGDYIMAQVQRQQRQLEVDQSELERLRRENERLRQQRFER